MILHRVRGRTSRYVLLDAKTGDVKSDALVFFPADTYEGVLALEVLLRDYITGESPDTSKVELAGWLEQMKRTWEDIRNAEPWRKDDDGAQAAKD